MLVNAMRSAIIIMAKVLRELGMTRHALPEQVPSMMSS